MVSFCARLAASTNAVVSLTSIGNQPQLVAAQLDAGHVHADGRVARRRGVARNAGAISRRQHRDVLEPGLALPLRARTCPAGGAVRPSPFPLEFRLDQDVAQDLVGGHQAVAVAQQDVVDPDDVVIAQFGIVHHEAAHAHGIIQCEVQIVIEDAPVETIQSTNPALMSGTMEEQPRPAGVSAPERLIPTVTSGSSILSAKAGNSRAGARRCRPGMRRRSRRRVSPCR